MNCAAQTERQLDKATGTNWAQVVPGPAVVRKEPELPKPASLKAATNMVNSAREKYRQSEFQREIRPAAEGAVADFGLLRVEFAADAAAYKGVL
jgi:hypothetical protein